MATVRKLSDPGMVGNSHLAEIAQHCFYADREFRN
jgi:hypothetical protein